jgi:hypothetical protein
MAAHFEAEAGETQVVSPRGDDPDGYTRALEAAYEAATIEATKSQREELKAAKDSIAKEKLPTYLAIRSFDRAADAIKNGIRVFISYKFKQRPLADKFRDLIVTYGQNRLARDPDDQPYVFLAERGVKAGQEYRKQIREEIENAHWFFLLLPDMQFDREWPIWEAGYFQRGMASSERLICVHHKSIDTAAQLEDLQAYESSPERLKQLFTQLFFESQAIPGMKKICIDNFKKNLPRDVKNFSDLFMGPQPVPVQEIYSSFVDIKHKEGSTYDKIADLLSARIVDMKNLKEVFDRDDKFRETFGDLIASVNDEEHGQQWIEGLRAALNDVVSGRPPQPIRVPFRAKRGGVFWSHLHSAWSYDGKIDYFQVIFLEGFAPKVNNVPEDLNALETAVRWAYRSWYEIYNAYGGHLQASDVDEIYRYTQIAEQEAASHGVSDSDQDILLRCFTDAKIRGQLQENLARYYGEYRKPKKDGKLDLAFQKRDAKLMRKCLNELRPMSLWFLKIASTRFAELIAETVPEK